MALAVTHVILTIVLLGIFRNYIIGREKFPRYLVVVGGIAGLIPDIDIPLTWIYNLFTESTVNLHGLFTHSFVFPILFLLIGFGLHYQKQMKWAKICYVIAFGWTFHLFLDCLYGGYKEFLWPLFVPNYCPQWGFSNHATSIDAIILVVWLVHEEVHKRIRGYI